MGSFTVFFNTIRKNKLDKKKQIVCKMNLEMTVIMS